MSQIRKKLLVKYYIIVLFIKENEYSEKTQMLFPFSSTIKGR